MFLIILKLCHLHISDNKIAFYIADKINKIALLVFPIHTFITSDLIYKNRNMGILFIEFIKNKFTYVHILIEWKSTVQE